METPAAYADLEKNPPETEVVGREVVIFDEIDSTNTYGLEHGKDGMVIVADRQTAGRGRQGRTWHSAPGLGLWFTVVFAGKGEGLPFAAPLAVRDALAERCELRIKWPNDLLCGNKKVCGILLERRNDITVVGIGLNVHHVPDDFPPELRDKAGSLESEAGGRWDRCRILRDILTQLDGKVMLIRDRGIEPLRAPWVEACNLVGRRIQCGTHRGTVTDIDSHGAIILNTSGGVQTIYSGDITYLDGD